MEALKEILIKASKKEKEYMVLYEVCRDGIIWEKNHRSFSDLDKATEEYDYANERPRKYINVRLIIPTDISKLHKLSKYAKELNEDE